MYHIYIDLCTENVYVCYPLKLHFIVHWFDCVNRHVYAQDHFLVTKDGIKQLYKQFDASDLSYRAIRFCESERRRGAWATPAIHVIIYDLCQRLGFLFPLGELHKKSI